MTELSDVSDDRYFALAKSLQVEDARHAAGCLADIEALGLPADLFEGFVNQLRQLLPPSGDANRVLINLQRFLSASRSPQAWLALFEREPESCATLVQLFAASQNMADPLIDDP